MSKFIIVNEDTFLDVDPTIIEEEQYCDYHLYKVMKSPEQTQPAMSEPDEELTEEELSEDLFITVETTKQGIIINSNVYLTTEQWNTVRELDKGVFSCAVCEFQCDAASAAAHARSAMHARALDGHRPLKRFDLSITRKIKDNLHCAVCNALYPITSHRDHENMKSHEGNLLFAINKVSDILYNDGYARRSILSFNSNNIQAPNNAPSGNFLNYADVSRTEAYNPRSEATTPRSEAYTTRKEATTPRSETYGTRNEVNTPRNGGCSPSTDFYSPNHDNSPRSEAYSNTAAVMGTEMRNFNFKNMYEDIKVYEEEESEFVPPIEGVSYACMASKPRIDVPKFLKIDLGTKEVRVKYESWHMITQTNNNQVYCMVCNTNLHVRHRTRHCASEEHGAALAACTVVGAFEDYLIRNVNEKLYHCGHCNNLQVKMDIQLHIEKYHPMKNSSTKDINPLQIFPEAKTPRPDHSMNKLLSTDVSKNKLDIFGNFKFCPFGTEMVVSNLGCHTLMLVKDRYICALCDTLVQGDLIKHVFEAAHMQYIVMTPFIRPFQSNLTRAIRGSLHCLLCNSLVPVAGIYSHNVSRPHTAALARALGMRPSEPPARDVKYSCEGQSVYRTELDRFLSTLPPDSREALSRLQIKNHKGELLQLSDLDSSSVSPSSANNSPTPDEGPTHDKLGKPVFYAAEPRVAAVNPSAARSGPPTGLAYPLPGQMLTVSMIESGIPGLNTGSPPPTFKPVQLTVTGPIDLKFNGYGRIPVSPVRQPVDFDAANDLLSLYDTPPASNTPETKLQKELGAKVESAAVKVENAAVKVENAAVKVENAAVKVENVDVESVRGKVESFWGKFEKLAVDKVDVRDKAERSEKKAAGKVKASDVNSSLDSADEEGAPFRLDEPVLLRMKTAYYRVCNTAYHTLLHRGDGNRYCFVCSESVEYGSLRRHVDSRAHIDNLANNKFLCNFYGQLMRQMYLMYHCTICNVTMSRREIKSHLDWPTHVQRYDVACNKINKKLLKQALRAGVRELVAETQKEFMYVNIPETCVNVVTYVQSVRADFVDRVEEKTLEKKSQMVILKESMMKICFESWHGIMANKSGLKCILCQEEITEHSLSRHVTCERHRAALAVPFERRYYPALVRKVNENTVNCATCNLELPSGEGLVAEHVGGRKHDKKHAALLRSTSHADSRGDCYKDPITL